MLLMCFETATGQQIRMDDDQRRASQVRPIETGSIDVTGAGGSFYFLDQLGINMAMTGLASGESIDPDTYILGPGDMVTIVLEGNMTGTFRGLIVNSQGKITIPNVGSVDVNRVSITTASGRLSELVETSFRETESALILERPRNVNVHIAGDVPNPGSYFIPAHTRLDKAVLQAFSDADMTSGDVEQELLNRSRIARPQQVEMPNLTRDFLVDGKYSFRNIRMVREDGSEILGDLVGYVVGGDKSRNPVIQHGDVIYIYEKKAYAPQISISGSVMSPLKTEYRPDDTIERLLEIAGGFSFDADTLDIRVFRYSFDGIQQVPVEDYTQFELQPNDRIVVGYDRDLRFSFSAEVSGEAVSPGIFPVEHGVTTARELLEFAGGITDVAQPNAARLTRHRGPQDQLRFGRETHAYDRLRIRRTSDQVLEGFEYLALEDSLGQNHVFIDLNDPDQLDRVRIYDNDRLHIPKDQHSIFVFGQVMNSGYFTYDPAFNAEDYIDQAGGYAIAAETQRVFVIKAGSNAWMRPHETSIESGDLVFVDRTPYESVESQRLAEFQRREIRNRNIQLIFTGIGAIASVITAYVAVQRL